MKLTITRALCPVCDRFVAVRDGSIFKGHGKRNGESCPNSGKPMPSLPAAPKATP